MNLFRVTDKANYGAFVKLKGTFPTRDKKILHEVEEVGTNRVFTVNADKLQDIA